MRGPFIVIQHDERKDKGQRDKLTFLSRLVASIRTSVSERKDCTAPRYPTRFCEYFCDDMTSRIWNDAHDISYPNISRYMSFRRAVAFLSDPEQERNPISIKIAQAYQCERGDCTNPYLAISLPLDILLCCSVYTRLPCPYDSSDLG